LQWVRFTFGPLRRMPLAAHGLEQNLRSSHDFVPTRLNVENGLLHCWQTFDPSAISRRID